MKILILLALACASCFAQTPVQPILQPRQTFFDTSGAPCAGCSLASYAAGTTTPMPTYTDSTGGPQNPNPIILDASGGASIWLSGQAYKLVLTDALGSTIWSVDNVLNLPSGSINNLTANCATVATSANAISGGFPLCVDSAASPTKATASVPILLSSDLPTGHQAASANAAVTTNSVLAYGAVHDEQTTAGGACSFANTSATLTCPSSTFVSSDAGKLVLALPTSGSCPIPGTLQASGLFTLCTATISTFTDSAHVILNQQAIASVAVTARWGTDSVPGFNACAAVGNVTCKIPAGPYLMGSAPYYALTGAYDDGSYGTPAGCTVLPTITATLGSGGTAGRIASYTITNAGSGCTPNSSLQMAFSGGGCPMNIYNNGPCGSAYAYALTNGSGSVTSVTPVFAGFGFTVAPTVTVTPLGGDGAAAHVASLSGGAIASTVIDSAGGGYGASTFPVYGIGGTGCAPVANFQNVSTITVTAVGTAATSGGVTSISFSGGANTPGSGCTGNPTLVFGKYVCGSSLNAQCTNLAPLSPIAIPVQVMLPAYVNWEGPSTAQGLFGQTDVLFGVWDGKTVNNNQPAMFGSPLYIQDASINGLAFENAYWGIHSPFSLATSNISNNVFSATGIGYYFGATDLGSQLLNNTCFTSYACDAKGGRWNTRTDFPNVIGGFFNSEKIDITLAMSSPYNSVSQAIDDYFAANFWHPEFSAASLDFPETCKFPQTPNQRQTSNVIAFNFPGNTTGNIMCYPGLTQWGIIELARNNGGSNYHNITNLTTKFGARGMYYGIFSGGTLDGAGGGEGANLIAGTGDPYRTATSPHAPVIFPNWGTNSPTTTVKNVFYLPNSGSFSNSLWGLGATNGLPQANWQNINVSPTTANPAALNGDNNQNAQTFLAGFNSNGVSTFNGFTPIRVPYFPIGALGPLMLFNCTSAVNVTCTGTQPTWNTNGVFTAVIEDPISPSADIFDLYSAAGASELYSLASDGGITNSGANAFNGTTKFGASGSAFSAKYKGTGTLTYGAITAPACAEQPLTITGAAAGDACYASTGATDIGITFQYGGCRVSAANTAQVKICATVTGTPTAVTWTGWATH